MADRRSDGDLVAAALGGSQEAFGELVARYKDAVFGVAFHRLGEVEEARDAAQEAFLKAFLRLATLRKRSAFGNWLYRIADGTALDAARRRRGEVSLDAAGVAPVSAVAGGRISEEAELASRVREALAALTAPTRLAVILHYVNGYSHAEVAAFLGSTAGAIKTRISRARKQLRTEMAAMVEKRLKKESAVFEYVAEHGSGMTITGTAEAESAHAVRRGLTEKGYRVVKIERGRRTRDEPITDFPVEVARVILEQALKDDAVTIKIGLSRADDRATVVRYLIRGKWHEVMAMPKYVLPALRSRLAEIAGARLRESAKRQTARLQFDLDGKGYELGAVFTPKTVVVTLDEGAYRTGAGGRVSAESGARRSELEQETRSCPTATPPASHRHGQRR